MTYFIEARGLAEFDALLKSLGEAVAPAAASAINDTAAYARTLGSKKIRQRFNFKAGYLSGRLGVTRRASTGELEATVTGRDRPTSLARFAQGAPSFGKQRTAPKVRVSTSGGGQAIRNGFFMRLRKGSSAVSSENSNVGIAVRLAEGERVRNKRQMVPISNNLYLLYGPSVGQIYRTEAEKTVDEVSAHLAGRFSHYLQRSI